MVHDIVSKCKQLNSINSPYNLYTKCYSYIVYYYPTSVPVPLKMMASKKKPLIFYCHFIYFTFILFPEKKILKIKLLLAIRKLDTALPIIITRR